MSDDPGLDPLLTPPSSDPVDGLPAPDDDAGDRPGARRRARQRILKQRLAVGGAALLVALIGLVVVSTGNDDPAPSAGQIRVDAWAPYWAFDNSIDDLDTHGDLLHEVSPFAYLASGATQIALDPSADPALVEEFISTARSQGIDVVPSVLDDLGEGGMADVLIDPTTRSRHVDALVALADELDADGLDIDYETFAFRDDRSTWPATRPAFATFVDELAAALHADGRTLSVSIPPVYDGGTTDASGYWVYDYARIAESADRIRVMAYDYSGQSAGPISPLEWVRTAIDGAVEAAGSPDRIVLGIPLYGNNVPIDTDGVCPTDAEVGRTAVTIRSVDDLIERRSATPTYDAVRGEWSFTYPLEVSDGVTTCTQTRQVNYVDSDGARARIDLARDAGLAGVSLWALGYEDDSLWAAIDPVVLRPAR